MNIGSVVQVGGAVRHNPLPPLTPFNEPSLVEVAGEKSNSFQNVHESSLGGFIGGGQLAWRATGSTIEVLDPLNCTRLAAWTFGAILHNSSAKITCVCGIGVGSVTHAVVGIDLGEDRNPQGMVGILSLRRSRITRAFHFRHKVTNVCMVTGGDKLVDTSTLSPELRSCKGLLAVATGHAFLFLVDLALDLGANKITSDEVSPATFVDISIPDPHSEIKRNEAIGRYYHPILCLSENFSSGGSFQLLGPDDNILFEAPSHTVNIASLLYIPQLASLIVGYSFGSFQIINLSIITIDCASPYEENLPPVFTFAYQEPENDPRSFVYLWVCRSCPLGNGGGSLIDKATCSLYAMNYEKKEWIEGHGLWYQGLQSMSPRFEFDATGGIGQQLHSLSPSKIFSAMTVMGISSSSITTPLNPESNYFIVPSDEESDPVPELSLCTFCWEGKYLDQGREVLQHYIAIFDINQWYQAQMPGHLRLYVDNLCPFMSFHIMDKVPKSVNEKLLSAAPKIGSWSRHSSKSHCENDWYPSSLSYDFNLLTSEGLVTYRCPSVQQSAISSLTNQGPGAIVNPQTSFNACLFAGIIPPEVTVNCSGSTIISEREQLLNIALEYHLLSLIVSCVMEFSEGRFSHVGCSLQLLLDWAWNKIRSIKDSYDSLCAPLFLTSEPSILSDVGLITLHQNLTYLSHLNTIVKSIKDNAGEVTIISAGELEGRVQVVNLLQMHLQAILWFYHSGLLPQCSSDDNLDGKSVPFPAKALRKIYDNRRSEIRKINPSLNIDDLLLIDCILEESGSLLIEIWSETGQEDIKKIYPPPSLHSLLNMYLLPGMTTATKHRIIQYLFLDLVSMLSDNYLSVVEEFVKFPASVSMSPSINKLTQAFWLIDQKDFEMGLSVLLDPLVNPSDITPMQHQRIIKAFLYQGEEAHALSYIQLRHPPETNLEDIQINLTVLLANGRIREAFHYQRKRRVTSNAKELLNHLFTGCEKLGRLESIVHLPLSPMEEEAFVNYLNTSSHPATQDILLIYYLQQSRYGEISKLHDGIRDCNNSSYNRQKTRNAIVQGYLSHLPDIRASFVYNQNPKPSRIIYTKPQPLSARIRQSAHSVSSTSNATVHLQNIQARDGLRTPITKAAAPYTPFRSKIQRRKAINEWNDELGLGINTTNTENTPRLSQRNNSHMVFPTIHEDEPSKNASVTISTFNSTTKQETPNKQINKTLKNISSLREDISKAMVEILRKSLQTREPIENISVNSSKVSCDVVSLLKTPPVHRKPISQQQLPINESLTDTPQSILKVRKILQHSQTPEENENPISSFPLYRSISKTSKVKSSEKSLTGSEESGMFTPKQLRFDLPSRKLSVDDNNSIVNDIEIRTPQPLQETGIKRKRSHDSSSPNDLPTPRKPLPNFGKDVNLSFRLNFPETDSEDEFDSTSPRTSASCTTKTTLDSPVGEISEIKTAFQSSIANKNGSITSLEPALTINSSTFDSTCVSSTYSVHKVCSNSIQTSKSAEIVVNTTETDNHCQKSGTLVDHSAVNLKYTVSTGSKKNNSLSIKSAEHIKSPSKVTPKQFDSNENTLKLKLLNHINESIHKSHTQSPIEMDSFNFPIEETHTEEKKAVKNFLNGILGSDNVILKAVKNNLTTDKNNTKISNNFGTDPEKYFDLSKDGSLEKAKNSSLTAGNNIKKNNNSIGETSEDIFFKNKKNPSSITDRNNSILNGSIGDSFTSIDDFNEIVSVELDNAPIVSLADEESDWKVNEVTPNESQILCEFIDNVENKNYDMSFNNSYKSDKNFSDFGISVPSFDLDESDSKEITGEKVVGEVLIQKQNISVESIEEVFENAVENFSYTELSKDVSQFLNKNRSISKGDSERTENHCLFLLDESMAGNKTSLQLTTDDLEIEENVNVLDDIDSNYVLTFSDSEEEKELCKVPEPVKDRPITNSALSPFGKESLSAFSNPVEVTNLKCVNTSPLFTTQLEEIVKDPISLTKHEHKDNSVSHQTKLIEPMVLSYNPNKSKNNIPESFLNTSYVPVIDFSAEKDENISNLNEESSLSRSELAGEVNLGLSGPKSPIMDANTSCIPVVKFSDEEKEEGLAYSDICKESFSRSSLPQTEIPRKEHNEVALTISNKIEIENASINNTCIPNLLIADDEREKSNLGALTCKEEHKQEAANNESSISHFKLTELPLQNINTLKNSSITLPICETQVSNEKNIGNENHVSAGEIINDDYHSDDSDKTIEFNITINNTTSTREIFTPLPTVPEVPDETETTNEKIEEPIMLVTGIDNNNISKINSYEIQKILTPSRKKKNLNGLESSVIEDKTSLSTPSTPLRRSRRLSTSTPSKTSETDVRRQRRFSETNESESSEVFLPLEMGTEVGSNSNTSIKNSANTLCFEPFTPLKEIEKDEHLPSTPLSSSRMLRERKSITPQRVDTPIRRSSRLSRSMDNLKMIIEENKVLEQTPKKTPLRSKRKSLASNAEPLLETICEDSEFKNLQAASRENSPSKLSPLEAASTTTLIINRAYDLQSESFSHSVKRNQKHSVGRRRKSASVSPELLSKVINKSGFSISRRTRRSSESSNVSLTSLPETMSQAFVDYGESKENKYSKSRLDVDQNELVTIGSIPEDTFPLSKLNLVKNMNNCSRKSLVTKNASRTFNLPVDTDLTFESPIKSRKPYRRRNTAAALSSSVVLIPNHQANSVDANSMTVLEPFANGPTQEIENFNEKNSIKAEESSPAISYNLLEAPAEGLIKNLGTLRTSSSANKGKKRKQSHRRGVVSLSLPVDRESSEYIEEEAVPAKKQRKSSSSKNKTTKSSASKLDSVIPQIEESSAIVQNKEVLKNDSLSTSTTQIKLGARKTNRKR